MTTTGLDPDTDDPTRLPGVCQEPWCGGRALDGTRCNTHARLRRIATRKGHRPGPPRGPRAGEWWVDLDRLAVIVDAGLEALDASGWETRARCGGDNGPGVFYADDAGRAKTVCATCPVLYACLADAVVRREEFGVWGGTTRSERKRLARELRTRRTLTAVG